MELFLGALTIFCLRIGDVSAGTLRVVFLVNGRRLPATLFAVLESAIWILALSRVFSHLDHWQNMVGYSLGYATGTLVGISLERTIAFGEVVFRIITAAPELHLRDRLASEGYGVTLFWGEGVSGRVQELMVVVPRRRRKHVIEHVHQIDPKAFITIENVAQTVGGYRPRPVKDHNK
ncbi:MAG: DUF2179 domain-containing protein [Tepidisphaeraceae bacterium]